MSAGQKIQDLGWMSAGVLYHPAECQGHLGHLNSGAKLAKPFLRQAAWSRSIASVKDLAIPYILEVVGSQ